ncbi:thrombomodulin-like [Stegastes partitus]|uniref:Thrombomodulin n=1 Tax=Stegastes partitus TaxID=144197 RepID=A0A9Y4NQL8_9TELE|nr:PREDICTED: thrombomodulin-like [Stegastes partitus]
MNPRTPTLLFCLFFLCRLEEALLSRLGYCAGDLCVFQAAVDFDGAVKECQESGGELLRFSSEENILESIAGAFDGKYWLQRPDKKSEEAAEGIQTCPSVFVTPGLNVTVSWEPCRDKLNGFLCDFVRDGFCSRLQTLGGAQITYTTFSGLAVADSDAFPAGTTAVKRDADGEPPASKYLCSSANWLPAPWPCEVLNGGCEFNCSSETQTCTCPEGQILHPNNISCTKQPCADGAQGCLQVGAIHAPECPKGFRLAQDGKSCEDINECEEDDPCTAEGEECENTSGGFMCICQEDFVFEDGMCVNITICGLCEQMICPKIDGVYQCDCRKGFRVSPQDPTKCEQHCTERDCPAKCVKNPDQEKKNMQQCFCPDGYITDIGEGTAICTDINECENQIMCEHKCENLFGGYRCLCNESFKLQDGYKCVPLYEPDEGGSGSTESFFTPASRPASGHSAPLPSYIKTGSILGITLFLLLCLGLLCFLIRNAFRRCGKFQLSSLKHPDIDIFYLQQVTTETYKRLSFDKQFKNDSQRL